MKISNINVELLDYTGSDLTVTNSARISFHKESCLTNTWDEELQESVASLQDKDIKLIKYLAKHNHWSPFAHNSLTFRIKAPIFVARQLVKHQVGGVWNEVSRRYVDEEPEFYIPLVLHSRPEKSIKQGSGEKNRRSFQNIEYMKQSSNNCLTLYKEALADRVSPEEARMFLPLNTMTEWWWTGSLMFFARVCKQRLDPHAQNATREVASLIAAAIPPEFSHSWKALMGQSTT